MEYDILSSHLIVLLNDSSSSASIAVMMIMPMMATMMMMLSERCYYTTMRTMMMYITIIIMNLYSTRHEWSPSPPKAMQVEEIQLCSVHPLYNHPTDHCICTAVHHCDLSLLTHS
jgi:hypothetical protein